MSQILVELQEFMGSDRSIANAAWTSSFDKNKRDTKTEQQVEDLVKRLAREGHATPFESVVFRFWIRHPIFVDRQHMTHRIGSHNGLSGRYRTMPLDWYKMPTDVSDIINKGIVGGGIQAKYEDSCRIATENYKYCIDAIKESEKSGFITNKEFKRAREVLRGQLPTSGMTERTTIFNLRSFSNYIKLRHTDYAQPEIKEVASLMLKSVKESGVCPIALQALEEVGWRI